MTVAKTAPALVIRPSTDPIAFTLGNIAAPINGPGAKSAEQLALTGRAEFHFGSGDQRKQCPERAAEQDEGRRPP